MAPDQRRVYAADRGAFWGASFRTCTFSAPAGRAEALGRFYAEAVLRPDNSWILFRVSECDGHSERKKLGETTMDFFSALDHVAKFEKSQPSLHNVIADADEKQKLGFEHYEAFGRREGIVFDIDGLPHETYGGKIITEGQFRPEDVTALKNDYKAPQEKLKASFSSAANNDAVRDLMPNFSSQNLLIPVFEDLRKKEKLHNFVDKLTSMKYQWQQGLDRGFHYAEYNDKKTFFMKTLDFLHAAEQLLQTVSDFCDSSPLSRGLEVCKFALHLDRGQQAYRAALNSGRSTNDTQPEMLQTVEECRNSLRRLGVTEPDLVRMEAALMQGPRRPGGYEYRPPLPPLVEEFIQSCAKLENEMAERVKAHEKALAPASGRIRVDIR